MTWIESINNLVPPFDLSSLSVPGGLRLLVLAPHPDDFDAIGVTMRLLQRMGASLLVTPVRGGSGVEDSYCDPPTIEVKAATRVREQKASCQFFGLPHRQLQFLAMELDANQQPLENDANRDSIADVLCEVEPAAVFLPHYRDTNSGHRRMYRLFKAAADKLECTVALFLNKDPKTINMRFDCYTAFDDQDAEWKGELLRFHDSQHQRNLNLRGYGLDHRLLEDNRETACKLGLALPYAEAFEIEFVFKGVRTPRPGNGERQKLDEKK